MGDIEQQQRDPVSGVDEPHYTVRVVSRIADVPASAWDACAAAVI